MRTIDGLVLAAVLAALQSCATIPAQTPQSVAAREQVLLATTARWGRMVTGRDSVAWEIRGGNLQLTPTTLYYTTGSTSLELSYAMISDVAVRPVGAWNPFGSGAARPDQLVIQLTRTQCGDGCVFDLPDGAQALRAREIIEAQRALVDPFGRLDGPRTVWLSAGIRNALAFWSEHPAYLAKTAPAQKKALEQWFCARTDCKGSGRSAGPYGDAIGDLLSRELPGGYRFRVLDDVTVNRRAELDTGALMRALETADPAVNSLLVSDLMRLRMREKVSADYRISVEVALHAFVDYYDLDPPKDGRYFWEDYTVTKPVEEWLGLSDDGFVAIIEAAARQVGCRILGELVTHGGAVPDAICPVAQASTAD